MKSQIKQKIFEYTAIFEPAEEGGYVVSVPALDGCVTQGETFEEAAAMVKDAIEGYINALKDLGKEIPRERGNVVVTKVSVQNPSFI